MGCNKGASWSQQIYEGDRLKHPLRRVGERGSGQWERISWDEATTDIANKMLDVIEAGGPEDIAREGTPEIATVVPTDRFFNMFGGRAMDLHASFNDFSIGLHETFGKFCPVSSGDDWFKSEMVLIWHMNPAYTRIPLYHFMLEARYKGAEVVSISPDLNASHMHSDYWVPMTPGNDVPFGLAVVQVILEEGLEDKTFIREQTDLPMLVRTDTGRFLRQIDVEDEGREDQLYHWDPETGLVEADRANMLLHGQEVALEGSYEVTLADGTTVTVEPVMARLRRKLDAEYTPEQQVELTKVHPGPRSRARPQDRHQEDQHHVGLEQLQVLPRRPDRADHVPVARRERQLGQAWNRHPFLDRRHDGRPGHGHVQDHGGCRGHRADPLGPRRGPRGPAGRRSQPQHRGACLRVSWQRC